MARPDPQRLRFSKMHGAGNDFVVIDRRDEPQPLSPALCRAMADRHIGVGCDQILTVEPPAREGAVASYRIWNADGSPSRQCGNGARCIAAWLVREGSARDDSFELDSPAGRHAVEALGDGRFRIAMGVPSFAPADIPLHGFEAEREVYVLDLDGVALRFGAVSMGNPHAVVEVDDVAAAAVAMLALRMQAHAAFPESVNVGFAQVLDRGRVRLRVYERGVGETLACGSGACAAAALLMRRGRIDREVVVSLPGGELGIAWPADTAQVAMTGPTAFVFEGEWLS